MRVLISGSSGMIGSALTARLARAGHQVGRLLRDRRRAVEGDVLWDADTGRLDPARPETPDAVIHLAGESIAESWTAERKARIRQSRVQGTEMLSRSLAAIAPRPPLLVSASAIGYYGDRGDELLDESSLPGRGFLADVCGQWEAATQPAVAAGIRSVVVRIGLVLHGAGGALGQMLPIFRLGLGGPLGSGRQYMSWIGLEDLLRVFEFALAREDLAGPVNAVAPNPVTNAQFARTLGEVLGRPAVVPAPAFALRLMFGQRADELLLASARVVPRRLLDAGFEFLQPELRQALTAAVH